MPNKKWYTKVYGKYTKTAKWHERQKNTPSCLAAPHQWVKSSIEIKSSKKREHKNKLLKAWSNCSIFSNDLQFFSFQMAQKKHKGAALHAFLLFFPIKIPCQLKSLLSVEGSNPFYAKQRKIQLSQSPCYSAIKKSVILLHSCIDNIYLPKPNIF